jgi:hypothetical protein
VESDSGALAAGVYSAVGLLGARDAADVRVGKGGRIEGYAPVPRSLSPHESLVFELRRRQ